MCGSAEIDGYGFCLGLKSLEAFYKARPDLHNLVRSVTYLIRQANFRPTHGICWSDMSFLTIRPLGELLDMFHAHKATERHDKVYALLGMSSDAVYAPDLFPDYDVPWGQVVQRLIKFLLGKLVYLETWDDKEMAVFKSKGFILGEVSLVVPYSGWGDTHKVDITSKDTTTYLGSIREWSASLTLHNSAKSIQPGDIVYLPQGAPRPIIIRTCKDYFAVIVITTTPPEYIRTKGKKVRWSELLHSVRISLHDFLFIWDWTKTPNMFEEYEALVETGSRVQKHSEAERKVTRLENMAVILVDLGEYKEAEERLQEARRVNEKAFGLEHSDTLTSMGNLASMYQSQGRWKEAEELEVQVMKTSTKALGLEHPVTLTNMSNLASMYQSQGRWKEAEELEVQVMKTITRVLGLEHPVTLTSIGNLASMYQSQGRWKEAEELEVQVMKTSTKVLGLEHPDTLTSMGNLASMHQSQGRWKEAEELEVQVMKTSTKVLRLEHPDTLISMGNLALTYRSQGRWKEAEELEVQVMKTSARVLGLEHLNTLTSMGNLASTYRSQGRWKEAEELEVQVMKTSTKVLGLEHPDTLTSMGNLAFTLKSQSRNEEAISLMKKCFHLRKQILGPQHPCTTSSLSTLNSWKLENTETSV
jgi:tetratricopeptide (TPR) repeat protein